MNEFKRKQWTRIGLSLVAVIVAVLFLTGVIGGTADAHAGRHYGDDGAEY